MTNVVVPDMDKAIGPYVTGILDDKSMFTPRNIADDMLSLLDKEEYFEKPGILRKTFLDIHCKSGRFLGEIIKRILDSSQFHYEFNKALRNGEIDNSIYDLSDDGKRKYLLDKNIYAVCPDSLTQMIVSKELTGDVFGYCANIVEIEDEIALAQQENKHKKSRAGKVTMVDVTLSKIRKEFGSNESVRNGTMNFNVVVGNPPYNDGMDIDFVFGAFEISKDYVLMITPAKWQTAEADPKCKSKHNYVDFRNIIVPYITHVCFYPDSFDIFLAAIAEGVSYYLVDKKYRNDKCYIENKCAIQSKLNDTEYRRLTNGQSLWNSGQHVIDYLGNYRRLSIEGLGNNRKYRVSVNKQLSVGGMGYRVQQQNSDGRWVLKPDIIGKGGPLLSTDGNTYALGKSAVIAYGDTGVSGTSFDAFSSDNKSECESFKSYIETKMIRFILLVLSFGLSSMGNAKLWEKVPAPMVLDEQGNRVPGKFDHIYTDKELYKTWSLPQKYIDIIESVIKERKL